MKRPDIDWFRALDDAEWLAGSTADTGERNLACAYLDLLRENGDLRIKLDELTEVAVDE